MLLISLISIFCFWISKPDLPFHFTKSKVSVEPVKAIDIAFLEQERINKERFQEQERLERIREQERKQEKTQAITKKLKEIIEVSTKVGLDRIQNVLEMDRKTFDNSIFRWAKEFGFTIDGDYLVINKETVSDFIESLDKEFSTWSKKEQNKIEKVE